MINRRNYHLTKEHLAYLRDVYQLSAVSLERYWFYLRHVLNWAGDEFIGKCAGFRPTFPAYVAALPGRHGESSLAPASRKKMIEVARRFLSWANGTYPREFSKLPVKWIDTLRFPRQPQASGEHVYVTLEEAVSLATCRTDPGDLALQRDRAAAAMLYLSGMRASAFATLPIQAVDLSRRAVRQWPELGVQTKNGKRATTYLLPVPELLSVVDEWDQRVRDLLLPDSRWYCPVQNRWGDHSLSRDEPGRRRSQSIGKRLRRLYRAAGLPYKSAHKFRHGHAVYGLQHAQSMADYKAVSLNLMHEDIKITDEIYAPILSDEVKQRISGMTERLPGKPDDDLLVTFNQFSNAQLSRALVIIAERLSR